MNVDVVCSGSGMNLFAFAGALWAAVDAGYTFRRCAGVSGGALIMSAVAAGIQPGNELNELLLNLTPVTQFMDPHVEVRWPWSRQPPRTAFADQTPWWWPFANHGLVAGKKLEAEVAYLLATKGVSTFRDLKKPLSIFTTVVEPTPSTYMLWSQETTPDDPVAVAAVASARIPGVFDDVVLHGARHVDGGVWDNFPVDCFNVQPDGSLSQGENTLGLYFGHDGGEPTDMGPLGPMVAVINIMMASRVVDSLARAPKAGIVQLPEGNALDFAINKTNATNMVHAGYQAFAKWSSLSVVRSRT